MQNYERQPLTNRQVSHILYPEPPEVKVVPLEESNRYNPKDYYFTNTFVKEEAPAYYRRYTPLQYIEIERRANAPHEYFDGFIYPVVAEGVIHQQILSKFITLLKAGLKKTPYKLYGSDKRLHIPENDLLTYPDLTIYACKPERSTLHKNTGIQPLVLIEVCSAITRNHDRSTKLKCYQQIPSLKEYILINTETIGIEHFYRDAHAHWGSKELNKLSQSLKFNCIEVSLSLKNIYNKSDVHRLKIQENKQQSCYNYRKQLTYQLFV